MTKAEKAALEPTQINCKELNDCVVTFLRTRVEWHRLLGNVQAKLQGQAQEREALEGFVRTQPRLGKRKRLGNQNSNNLNANDGCGKRQSTDDLAVELQVAMQQEVAATSISNTTTNTGVGGVGIGNAEPSGDDFGTDLDGDMADRMV